MTGRYVCTYVMRRYACNLLDEEHGHGHDKRTVANRTHVCVSMTDDLLLYVRMVRIRDHALELFSSNWILPNLRFVRAWPRRLVCRCEMVPEAGSVLGSPSDPPLFTFHDVKERGIEKKTPKTPKKTPKTPKKTTYQHDFFFFVFPLPSPLCRKKGDGSEEVFFLLLSSSFTR